MLHLPRNSSHLPFFIKEDINIMSLIIISDLKFVHQVNTSNNYNFYASGIIASGPDCLDRKTDRKNNPICE